MGTENALTEIEPEETRCGSVALATGKTSTTARSGKTEGSREASIGL